MVRKIVLSIATVLLLGCFMAVAQNRQVSGTVSGEDGSPIVGATVVVLNSSIGTTTDTHGHYTVSVPANSTLGFSFLGYDEQEIAVGSKSMVNVVLKETHHNVGDVIVVAFGTAKKEAFTGSAKVVESGDLAKTQSSTVSDALVGKIAGVQFSAASGSLGSGQTIRIRGYGSISAGKDPLWIVDGAPYEGDINNINTADIESISVLKDAASNALYGARGANGVIMVTTKRAKAGDAHVTFDGKWGVNTRALRSYDIIDNAGEYYEAHYKALYNYYTMENSYTPAQANIIANQKLTSNDAEGLGYNVFTVPDGQNLIGSNGKLNPLATEGRRVTNNGEEYYLKPDNWLDELYKSSFRQEYNVSVSGATDKSNFYASVGYLDNEGIIDGSKMDRLTARLRADYQAKKWLKVGANMSYTHFNWYNGNNTEDEGASDGGNAFATCLQLAPIYPVYVRDGNGNIKTDTYGYKVYDDGNGKNGGMVRTSGGSSNDLQDVQLNKYISEGNAMTATGFADFYLYKGLKVTVNGNVNLDETRSSTVLNPYYGQFATSGGVVAKSHGRTISYNLQQLVTYNRTIAEKHNIDVLFGHEMYNIKVYGLSASHSKMFSYDNTELSGAVVDMSASASSMTEYNNEGYFFRGQYDYDGKYFFSGSYRRDASSKFHPDNRWGNFWSVGGAWIMTRENWLQTSWLDMLKLKASYGSQGNDNISSYLYQDYYQISNDGAGGIATVFARKGNKDITWETNTNMNVGVEFGVFKNRLSGSIEYFNRKTVDMLFSLPVPSELGYSAYYTNVGDMANRGIEIELNADLIRSKKVVWDFSLNMTHYKNKLLSLPEEYRTKTVGGYEGFQDGRYFRGEGLSFFTFYIPTYMGVDQTTGKSLWYSGETKDGVRQTTDQYSVASQNGRELHGNALPDVYGGFSTSVRAFGFDLSLGFTYQIGGQVYDSGYAYYMTSPSGSSTGFNYHRDLLDAWTTDNTGSNIPRFAYNDTYSSALSDRFLTDASYLNIQNITLGYTLPQHITRKFAVENLRIYVACDNVWYWSQRQGLDPRQSITGATNPFYYAPIRTISGGITLTF